MRDNGVGRGGHVTTRGVADDDEQRAVDPLAEPAVEQLRCGVFVVAGGLDTQLHLRHRDGGDGEQDQADDDHGQRIPGEEPGETEPVGRLCIRLVAVPDTRDAGPERDLAEGTQQCRDQCDGAEHSDDDRAGGRDTHLGDERDADDRECGDRDDHGEAGEHHRRSGGTHGASRRRLPGATEI